jgi:hypothetical protein
MLGMNRIPMLSTLLADMPVLLRGMCTARAGARP